MTTGGEGLTRYPVAVVSRAVLRHPSLWWTAVVTVFRVAAPGWWRRWPPLPLPSESYWRFRMVTLQGGRGEAPLTEKEVLDYLRWCRRARGSRH